MEQGQIELLDAWTPTEILGVSSFEEVRQKVIADLGQVEVDRHGQQRTYAPRAELLAAAVTGETFSIILDWLSSVRRESVETKRNYADDIRRVWAGLARRIGHERFSLGIFTPDHIRLWRMSMESAGASKKTISRYLGSLSSLHDYAAEKMDLPRNPVTQDDRPHIDRGNTSTSTPVLEVNEIQLLADQAQDDFDLLVFTLLYTLAGRVSEMCKLDVNRVFFQGDRIFLDLTRKRNKPRALPLSLSVSRLLQDHIGTRTEGPLLLDREGQRLDRHDVARLLARLGRHAGVLPGRKVTPHVLRASRITHMLDEGVPLAEVQAFADHDNPATTVGYWDRRQLNERNIRYVDRAESVFSQFTHVGTAQ